MMLAIASLPPLYACKGQAEKASKENIGDISVVSLYGTWEEMGRQYGELSGEELHEVFNFLKAKSADFEKEAAIVEIAESLVSRYPHRFKMFLEGVSQTSGLTLKQLVLANALEYAEPFFCSGMSAWGDYSKDKLVYGRNYDAASYRELAKNVIITVFHPSDGSLATAIIGYAGELYAVNALNSEGLFLELNNGMATAGKKILFNRLSSTASLLEAMLDADSLTYLDAFFNTNRSFASFIIGVADSNEARSYEWCAEDTMRGDATCPDGLMVMTNHYVNPDWTFPVPSDDESFLSHTRRDNLIRLANENKGSIDSEMMCRLMSKSIEEGGSMNKYTRYQLVYEPETMRLLIRVESAPSWTEIDMREFL